MVSSFLKPLLLICVLVWVIQEIEATLLNVGLSMGATQSTTDFDGAASRAVDGNVNAIYEQYSCTHTLGTGTWQPWWKVDLGQYYLVEHITVYNRLDCCFAERLRDVNVVVSNDDIEYKTFGFHSGQVGEKATIIPDKSKLPTHNALTARWIKIYLEGEGILTLCEVEIMSRLKMRKFAFDEETNGEENEISVKSVPVPLRVSIECIQACNRPDNNFFMRLNDESTSSLYLECYCPI